MRILIVCGLIVFFALNVLAQDRISKQEYINTYAAISVTEMERTSIPASITLAQGILESGSGNSLLSKNFNNHFGIKCHKGWEGSRYYMDDDAKNECFRVYKNPEQSFLDHSEFLMTRSRYAFLFELKTTDYKAWAKGLKKAGYATNPKYADLLIKIIEEEKLNQYDKITSKQLAKQQKLKPKTTEPVIAEQPKEPKPKAEKQTKPAIVKTEKTKQDKNYTAFLNKQEKQHIQAYSDGIFILNNIKTVKVKPGETSLSIAMDNGIHFNRLLMYNDLLETDQATVGANIFLQPKRRKGYVQDHTVIKGESMHDISQRYGIKLNHLYALNLMENNEQPKSGQKIYLRKARDKKPATIPYEQFLAQQHYLEPTAVLEKYMEELPEKVENIESEVIAQDPTPTPDFPEKDHSFYGVQKGDTLFSIAKDLGLDVETLRALNELKSDELKIGQRLIIP